MFRSWRSRDAPLISRYADADMEDLLDRAINQNYVPVVDDKGSFIGIITRKEIIKYCYKEMKKLSGLHEKRGNIRIIKSRFPVYSYTSGNRPFVSRFNPELLVRHLPESGIRIRILYVFKLCSRLIKEAVIFKQIDCGCCKNLARMDCCFMSDLGAV